MSNTQILIVEDEILIAMGLQKQLENFGYFVVGIASSGDEAIAKVIELQPDLVIMDIIIHGDMDGIEVARRVQEQFKIPVIYLTAYGDQAHIQRAKTTDPFGYLLKPFNERELQISIDIALYKDRTQKRIKEQQRWFSSILNSLGEAVITIDTHQTILFLNPAAEAFLQLTEESYIGRCLSDALTLRPSEEETDLKGWVKQALEEQTTVRRANLYFSVGETDMVLDLCISPIKDEGGGIRGGALVFNDRTEQHQMERKLKQQVPVEEEPELVNPLTLREKQVLQRMVEGEATKEVASSLNISPRTVEFHRYNLMRKLNIQDLPSLVRYAITHRLVDVE